MIHVDAMMFSRWTVVLVFMVSPLVVGCGTKTDTALDSANQPSIDSDSPIDLDSQEYTEPNSIDANPPGGLPEEVVSDAVEVDRPKSLFRSIGRALQRGVTDAAGAAGAESDSPDDASESDSTDNASESDSPDDASESDSPDDASESDDSDPTIPR